MKRAKAAHKAAFSFSPAPVPWWLRRRSV